MSGHQAAFYAGRWGDLELLFAGGVGASAPGLGRVTASVVAVVDIALEPLDVRVTAFDPSGPTRLADAGIPASIDALGGTVTRSPRWAD